MNRVFRFLAANPSGAQRTGAWALTAVGRRKACFPVTVFGRGLKPLPFRGNLAPSVVMTGPSRRCSSAACRLPTEAIFCFQTAGTPNSLLVNPTASAVRPPSTPAGPPAGVSFWGAWSLRCGGANRATIAAARRRRPPRSIPPSQAPYICRCFPCAGMRPSLLPTILPPHLAPERPPLHRPCIRWTRRPVVRFPLRRVGSVRRGCAPGCRPNRAGKP